MKQTLLQFNNLPFTPDPKQVIYVESNYDETINAGLKAGINAINQQLSCRFGLTLGYIPDMMKRMRQSLFIRYQAPYRPYMLPRMNQGLDSSMMLRYLASGDADSIGPGLLAFGRQCGDTTWYLYYPLSSASDVIAACEQYTQWLIKKQREGVTDGNSIDSTLASSRTEGTDPETGFDKSVERMMADIREKIEMLRARGVGEMVLQSLLLPEVKLSRMRITEDYRIFLIDYGNMEIKMTPLVKTVYFLFLNHPEGINLKEMFQFEGELCAIYRQVTGTAQLTAKMQASIRRLTDTWYDNSIHEKCARIHQTFLLKFDDRLAHYYYISGNWGEPKRILLSRDLVEWE